MSDNISNTGVFGTDNDDLIREMYEEMTRRDKDIFEVEDDTYEVNFEETCIDLCEAGFILINGRCVKR